jgi:hypothetical protein
MGRFAKLSAALVAVLAMVMPLLSEERVDLDAVHKIRQEALQNSKVMDHMFYLTDVYGPRVTNSPGFFSAADWVIKQLGEWGIKAHLEKWGPFGRGWTFTHFSGHLIEPQYAPLIGFPLAYSPGTNGPVTERSDHRRAQRRTGFREVQRQAAGQRSCWWAPGAICR